MHWLYRHYFKTKLLIYERIFLSAIKYFVNKCLYWFEFMTLLKNNELATVGTRTYWNKIVYTVHCDKYILWSMFYQFNMQNQYLMLLWNWILIINSAITLYCIWTFSLINNCGLKFVYEIEIVCKRLNCMLHFSMKKVERTWKLCYQLNQCSDFTPIFMCFFLKANERILNLMIIKPF